MATTKFQVAKLDELFVALRENLPIDKNLITQSYNEYTAIKMNATKSNATPVPKSSRSEKGSVICPHCKKKLSNDTEKENEIEHLKNQLHAANARREDLEMEIATLKNRDRLSEKSNLNKSFQLNDQYRAVGQKYEDLYNNEWAAVFSHLDNAMNLREDKVLDVLQRILRAAYSFCGDIARAQLINMEGEIRCPLSTWTEDVRRDMIGNRSQFSSGVDRIAKEYRSCTSVECIPAIQNVFIAQILPEFMDSAIYNNDLVLDYVRKCVEVTWYMWIQETPMILVTKVNRKDVFDISLFQFYSKTGEAYDFVVWPALLLCNEGPLVAKGVAQALDPSRGGLIHDEPTDPNKNLTTQRAASVPTTFRSNPPKPAMPRKGAKQDRINPALRGSPWGSNFYSDPGAGTPSVDLPPLPAENVSPTRRSPPRDPNEEKKILTSVWVQPSNLAK